MIQPKEYDWKDSNLALFGSDTEKQVKKDAAVTEKAWEGVDKIEEECLKVWRINSFKVEEVPKEEYGIFFGGDSYIVLKISKEGDALLYDVHFWIGAESTADEYGTAAYKTVELDTFLDDKAVQHREVQDYESEEFLSYFDRVEILRGGHKSGFRHVEVNQYKPRLLVFHVAGRGRAQVNEVPLSQQSLNSDDVFILDLGETAYQWNGKNSNGREKVAAAAFLQQLESERSGRCKTENFDEHERSDTNEFLKHLPDVEVKKAVKKEAAKALYKISDASGKLTFSLVNQGAAPRGMITEDDVFFIMGSQGLFVHIGSKCSKAEKNNAMSHAHAYLQGTEHPFAPITVVSAGKKNATLESMLE